MKQYVESLKNTLDSLDLAEVNRLCYLIRDSSTVYIIGNGGSMAAAMHLAEDLIKISNKPAIAISDVALISMSGNDEGWPDSFLYPLKCITGKEENELIIGMTMGGGSKNIIKVMLDKELPSRKFLITGVGGSEVDCDRLVIPTGDIQIAEDVCLSVIHMICKKLGDLK